MRTRIEKPTVVVPQRYKRYRPEDWPGGWHAWVTEREAWAAEQPPVTISGQRYDGAPYSYLATPLGDFTDLVKARREARMIDFTEGPEP
jgi:hypothetical protein